MNDTTVKEAPEGLKPHTDFVKGWLAAVADDHDVIAVRRTFVDICDGDLLAGIIFSQIFYYNSPSKKGKDTKLEVIRDGHRWLAKTYKDWWDECRINEMTARRKIELLKSIGLIETGVFRFAGNPTLHIRIDFEQFEARYNLWMEGLEDEEKSRSVQIEQNQMSPFRSVQIAQLVLCNLNRTMWSI